MQLPRAIRARARRLGAARLDALIALAFVVEGLLEAALLYPDAEYVWIAVLGTLLIACGLALRSRAPIVATAFAIAGFVVFQPLGREVNDNVYAPFFAVLFVLFSFGLHEQRPRALVGMVAAVFCSNAVVMQIDDYPTTVIDVIFGGLVLAGGPVLLGRVIASRSRLNAALAEKAERLRHSRKAELEQAAVDERARIANELHDVVAHAMSAMVVQAGGARRLAVKDPERARAAFAAVEDTGREALTEIRRLLGVLRRDDEELALAPQPSLAHLRGLVARMRAAGLAVELEVEGEQAELPAGLDLTAYRVIQEALDGALAAPDPRRATVRLRYRDAEIALDVTDVGDVRPAAERPLLGVRERVAIYGGELVAEPVDASGYAVRARLPLERVA
jgi:signal transduction histidine kinase